ncbi:MAG: hypothetical protein HUJ72_02045 [Blautia sp.]|nr:hypothetical protein [Blautia sp.]
MKRNLTNNIPLKLMSLLIGFVVWLLVLNVDNPVISRTFVIPNVELLNEAYIEDTGKMCMLDERQSAIKVTITAERKAFNSISTEDIRVVADLQQAVSLQTDPVMVPITATCSNISANNISVNPHNFSVHLEEKMTQDFAVSVNSGESKPGKGYEIGSQTVNPEKIRITGPKALVGKIDIVRADVNVEGITQDKTEEVSLKIIDKNADVLSDASMSYLKIGNDARVNVMTHLWKVRTDVKLKAGYTGSPEYGYEVDTIQIIPETISITGSKAALSKLMEDGNAIVIPDSYLDVSGKNGDVEEKVDLNEILPDDLRLTSGSGVDAWVKAKILPTGSKLFYIPTSDIKVNNIPENMQVTFDIDKIEVRVHEEEADIREFNEEIVKASIDIKDLEEGDHDVPVDIVLPSGFDLVEEVKTGIRISKIAEASINEDNE